MRKHSPRVRLRLFRQEQQLSVAALAEKLGCDKSFVSMVENGKRRAGLDFAARLQALTAGSEHAIGAAEWSGVRRLRPFITDMQRRLG